MYNYHEGYQRVLGPDIDGLDDKVNRITMCSIERYP